MSAPTSKPPFPTEGTAQRDVDILRARAALEQAIASGHRFEMNLTSYFDGARARFEVPSTEDRRHG